MLRQLIRRWGSPKLITPYEAHLRAAHVQAEADLEKRRVQDLRKKAYDEFTSEFTEAYNQAWPHALAHRRDSFELIVYSDVYLESGEVSRLLVPFVEPLENRKHTLKLIYDTGRTIVVRIDTI
jgi:hypothetical protein